MSFPGQSFVTSARLVTSSPWSGSLEARVNTKLLQPGSTNEPRPLPSPLRKQYTLQHQVTGILWLTVTAAYPLLCWLKVSNNKLWKILQEMGIPDYLTCLLRNLCADSGSNRPGHGTTDWFQIRKRVCQGCILSPCLFNLYAEYIIRNAGLEEAQAGLKIARRNINNLRYADDTTLMAESEEELKSLLMKVKEESEKVGLKLHT